MTEPNHPVRRPSGMRTFLATLLGGLLALTLLAGCSDDQSGDQSGGDTRGSDSGSGDSGSENTSSPPATGSFTEVEIVSATEGGGSSQDKPLPLTTDAEVTDFVAELSEELAGDVRDAVEAAESAQSGGSVPQSHVVAGQIVGIGCEVPTTVQLKDGRLVPTYSKGPEVQCIAPVTSIAIVTIDEELL